MPNPNKIRLAGGIIRLTIIGKQDFDSADANVRKLDYYVSRQRLKGKPALILVDVRKEGRHSPAALSRDKDFFSHDFDKIAVVGAKGAIYNFFRYTAGQLNGSKVEYFKTESTAIKWLEADPGLPARIRRKPHAATLLLLFIIIIPGV